MFFEHERNQAQVTLVAVLGVFASLRQKKMANTSSAADQ